MTSILDSISDNCPDSWVEFFLNCSILHSISDKLENISFGPNHSDVFNAFREINPENINVAFIVENPYTNKYKSNKLFKHTGSALCHHYDDYTVSQTLKNIFQSLDGCYGNFPTHPNQSLEGWKEQGVFLLNSQLTFSLTKFSKINHKSIWQSFINTFIKYMKNREILVIYLGSKGNFENFDKNNKFLYGGDPSEKSFTSSTIFRKISNILSKENKSIDWCQT